MVPVLAMALVAALAAPLGAATYSEAPELAEAVRAGLLPPVDERLPSEPSVVSLDDAGLASGQYGGELRMLVSQPKDTRMMIVYGYARLVGYDAQWNLVPDLLAKLDVQEDRIFTLHLRNGHRWSDGHPFTAEDFRFYWEDIANNAELSAGGPERFLLVDGQPPRFEVIDERTVRYSWDRPNPFFLPALAGARPEYIYAPAHYLKPLHPRYRDMAELKEMAGREGQRNWASLFNLKGQQYRNDNPELADAGAVEAGHQAAIEPLPVRPQPILSPGRPRRTAASLHRHGRPYGGQPATDSGEVGGWRRGPAGARPELRELHHPQAGREPQRLSRPAVALGARR